jgi:spore maturation protein CgeB
LGRLSTAIAPVSEVRAILIGEFWAGATARGLVSGLRAAKWLVDELDFAPYLTGGTSVAGKIEARLRKPWRLAALRRALIETADRHGANLVLAVKGLGLDPATLATLKRNGVKCANYYPDSQFDSLPLAFLAHYDLVVTTKSFEIAPLQTVLPAERVAFVHHGYTPEVHRRLPRPAEQDIDVLHIGNAAPEKATMLVALASAMPDLNLRVIGAGWADYARGTPLERAVAGIQLIADYYAAEIARAKITLGVHMGKVSPTSYRDLVSTRSFEITACGGFMLHVDNDEIRSLYDVPSEIDTFTDPADLVAKIRYWLAHPAERDAVAARGHARAVPAYSYTERGLELAALIERKLGFVAR